MNADYISPKDRQRAQRCLECLVCNSARQKQRGLAFWFLKTFEGLFCPYCRAYKKVYGRQPYEPVEE